MEKRILVITDYKNAYRQDISRSQGIDLVRFKQVLEQGGYAVSQITYNELVNHSCFFGGGGNWNIVYTSSENIEYKEYIKDIIYDLQKRNKIIPGYDLLMCHEDKLYQEIYKRNLGIQSLDCQIYATLKDLQKDIDSVNYPVVVKKCAGAGSISVFKANSKKELIKYSKKIMLSKDFFEYYLKAAYKKMLGKLSPYYFEDEKYFGRLVLQQYVPNLECDWKVLIFGKKYYALRRDVRRNDFRASGSGKFSFEIPDAAVLTFAQSIFEKMKVPFLSLDLCIDDAKTVYLIEFQGIHFGPYTLIESPHYFVHNGEWEKIEQKSDLAVEYAKAIIQYIEG